MNWIQGFALAWISISLMNCHLSVYSAHHQWGKCSLNGIYYCRDQYWFIYMCYNLFTHKGCFWQFSLSIPRNLSQGDHSLHMKSEYMYSREYISSNHTFSERTFVSRTTEQSSVNWIRNSGSWSWRISSSIRVTLAVNHIYVGFSFPFKK